ncbi:MAG: ATP-dependent helicase, partial [Cytophagales bacterium]|nr:ATP-dependent helicase [Cytophagales bacterium]
PRFQQRMGEKQRYDFQDMIQWMVRAFQENGDMLLRYQEKYQFILVDEFQDTSGAQNEILNLLTSFDDNPNIFAVGDDDQSIYGFQGAKVKKMNDFVNKYKDINLRMIVLTENYRSTQSILDAAGQLIAHNTERLLAMNPELGLQKELKASHPEISKETAPVQVLTFSNSIAEEAYIVEQLEQLKKSGTEYKEMAVLYRNHKDVANIINVLEKRKIPYSVKQRINVLDDYFIQQLLKIIQYISIESKSVDSGDYLLFEIMHFEWFGIPTRDIQYMARSIEWGDNRKPKPWRSVTSNKLKLLELGISAAEKVSQLENLLSDWSKNRYNQTLQVWFEQVLVTAGILEYIMGSPQKVWLLQVLNTFFDFIKSESAKRPSITLE